jgi:hypothetical protein
MAGETNANISIKVYPSIADCKTANTAQNEYDGRRQEEFRV